MLIASETTENILNCLDKRETFYMLTSLRKWRTHFSQMYCNFPGFLQVSPMLWQSVGLKASCNDTNFHLLVGQWRSVHVISLVCSRVLIYCPKKQAYGLMHREQILELLHWIYTLFQKPNELHFPQEILLLETSSHSPNSRIKLLLFQWRNSAQDHLRMMMWWRLLHCYLNCPYV